MDNLLSYTGDASLGLGSSPQIPVSSTEDLKAVNETTARIQQQNAYRNHEIFQQKIKDRDNLYNAIDSGDIKIGSVLEQDRPIVKSALDNLDKAYFDRVKKGVNDLDAAAAYKKALRDAQETVTHANARQVYHTSESVALSSDQLPSHQQARKANMDKVLSNFHCDLTPYVPALDFDHEGMNTFNLKDSLIDNAGIATPQNNVTQWTSTTDKGGKITTKHTEKVMPGKAAPVQKISGGGATIDTPNGAVSLYDTIPGKYIDYEKIKTNANDGFLHDEKQQVNQQKWREAFEGQNPTEAVQSLTAYNNRIKQYNTERGFVNPTDAGFVSEIKFIQNPQTGQIHIAETAPDFAAKTSLASVPGNFVQKDQLTLNKDAANYLVAKEKADTDAIYKKTMAANAGLRARAYAANIGQQMKLRSTDAEKDQFLEDMYKRNLVQQKSLVVGGGGNMVGLANITAQNSLPVFTLEGKTVKQLVPIDAKPIYSSDNYNDKGELDVKSGAKPLRYEGGYYKPTYRIGDKEASNESIMNIYSNFKKIQGKKWAGGYDDFIKQAIQSGDIKVRLTGANGTTDEDLSKAAQRIISNQATKKGQESPFSIEYSEDYVPDNNQ